MKKYILYTILSLIIAAPAIGSLHPSAEPQNSSLHTFSLHDEGVISDGTFLASTESSPAETSCPYFLSEIGADDIGSTLSGYDVKETVVAIIDTGAELSHEDLKDNLWINEVEKNGIENIDDDNNGYVDDIYGLDIVHKGDYLDSLPTLDPISGTASPKYDIPEDDSDTSHGTHVSGIVGMNPANTVGYAGVNHKTKIMVLKAGTSSNSFQFSNCIEAVEYAVNNGADVINMSFGSTKQSDAFASVLEDAAKSCILVAAAGNNGNASSNAPIYPASYPYIVGVMASNRTTGEFWTNSNWNDTTPACYDIICPGESIISTSRYNLYESKSGTSMSSPMVAGSAAVIMGFLEANKTYETREDLLADTKKYLYMSDSSYTYTNAEGITFATPRLHLKTSLQNAIQDLQKTSTATPFPTLAPTATPVATATVTPTAIPSVTPTIVPTSLPIITVAPSPTPTQKPTLIPTPTPTITPTLLPTLSPTPTPTITPTLLPTIIPTPTPTITPTLLPTIIPTPTPNTPPTTTPSSAPDTSTPPSCDIFPPVTTIVRPKTIHLQVTQQKGATICFKWNTNIMANTSSIYRSTKKNQLGKKIATTTNYFSFKDSTIQRGKTYYYRVVIAGVTSNIIKLHIPKKLTMKKAIVKKKNRYFVKWKAQKGITRYQIQVRQSGKGITNWYYTKKTSCTLRINTKTSIRIRAQVITSGRTYSGPFLSVKPNKKKK